MEEINYVEVIRNARLLLELTQEEAGKLVGVTRRAWEHWEAGTRKIPAAAFELFIAKISGKVASHLSQTNMGQLVVIIADDAITPIDVVSSHNFLSLEEDVNKNKAVINSLAVDRTNKPYKRKTLFTIRPSNEHVIRAGRQWQQA